jgi:hypothetical protein
MTARRLLGRGLTVVVASGLSVALLRWGTALPVEFRPPATARLRLSWSARPERIEVCRALSAEELAERPEHMRVRVECEGKFATYALRVAVDGRVAGDIVVKGGGFRQDRLLHVLQEYSVPAGPHRVRISFTRRERTDDATAAFAPSPSPEADTGLYAGRAQREVAERVRRARAAIPRRLVLETSLVLAPGRVALITFNEERRVLELRTEALPPR